MESNSLSSTVFYMWVQNKLNCSQYCYPAFNTGVTAAVLRANMKCSHTSESKISTVSKKIFARHNFKSDFHRGSTSTFLNVRRLKKSLHGHTQHPNQIASPRWVAENTYICKWQYSCFTDWKICIQTMSQIWWQRKSATEVLTNLRSPAFSLLFYLSKDFLISLKPAFCKFLWLLLSCFDNVKYCDSFGE